ncbi:MAG: carbonic anhydrase [Phycisphaerae bacterium]
MKKRIEALNQFRHGAGVDGHPLPTIYDEQRPAQALVITCSESPRLGTFAASIDPLLTLQNWGGVAAGSCANANGNDGIDSDCGMVKYAIDELGIQHIVLCGHSKCRVPALIRSGKWPCPRLETPGEQLCTEITMEAHTAPEKYISQIWLARQRARLVDWLAEPTCAREKQVATYALWFDEDEGDIFTYSEEKKRFLLMSDIDIEQLFNTLEFEPPSHLNIKSGGSIA